jgi:D-xylose transport system substrate-binding protein
MLKNDGSADSLVNGEVTDTQANKKVKSVFATPVWVTQANIKAPFDAGYTTVAKVCTPDFAAACTKLGSVLARRVGPGPPGRAGPHARTGAP